MSIITTIYISEIKNYRIDPEYYKPDLKYISDIIQLYPNNYLKNLSYINGGKRLPKGANFSTEGIPYFRVVDINGGFITDEKVAYISYDIWQFISKYDIKKNDILVTIVGTVGLVGILNKDVGVANFTENCARIRNPKIDRNYLFAFLISKYGQGQVEREKVGTSQPKLSLDRLRRFVIPLFDEDEIEPISKKINRASELYLLSKSLYTQATQLLEEALGLDKIEFKQEKCFTASFSEVINNSKISSYFFQPKYIQLKQLLASFETVKLRSIITSYSTGFAFSKNHINKKRGEAILLKIGNIKEMDIDISSTDYINSSGIMAGAKEKVNVGDLLIGMSGSVGVTGLVRENVNAYINQRILRIHPSVNINSEYLGIVLNSLISKLQFEKFGTGGVQVNISPKDMLNIDIPRLGKIEDEISRLSFESYKNKLESKQLLEQAKQEVETLIEQAAKKNE